MLIQKLFSHKIVIFLIVIILGIFCGLSEIKAFTQVGVFCSDVFIKIFRCISMPVVSLSVIVALSTFDADKSMSKIWKKTLRYTIGTTFAAASVSAILYYIINPQNVASIAPTENVIAADGTPYTKYLLDIVPDSIFSAFLDHKVLSVLLISVIFGVSIRYIKDEKAKQTVTSFFNGIHSMLFTITRFIVKILPIGMFGFITVTAMQFKDDMNIGEMGRYFLIIILANVVQGLVILPLWLSVKKISPIKTFSAMMPALSVGFFSKSSSGALPVTIECAENKLGLNKKISRFVLPLCTTINMNGCAAFIFTTVIFVMQNNGIEISVLSMLTWILVSTIAAIGNAGVPMGCFFLSVSLLSSMDVPLALTGIILPFYGILDMLETSLNIWSDSCVAAIVNSDFEKSHSKSIQRQSI